MEKTLKKRIQIDLCIEFIIHNLYRMPVVYYRFIIGIFIRGSNR